MTHPRVEALDLAVDRLNTVAPDLSIEEAAVVSDCQVRLAQIVLQIVETEKVRHDLEEAGL